MFDGFTSEMATNTTSAPSQTAPLPDGLSGLAPGAELGSVLAAIDRSQISGFEQVVVLQTWSRQVAHAQAELYASMTAVAEAEARLAGRDGDVIDDFELASSEIRAALTWTRRAAESHLDLALCLVEKYPQVWSALHRGTIDLPRARVIINQTCHLDRDTSRAVAHAALELAGRQTTGQLRARIQRLVIAVDPGSARRRYEQSLEERRITAEPTSSGTANLFGLDLPAADTSAAMRRINRLARAAKAANDPRTMDQVRADVFLDLLNGRDAGQRRGERAVVELRVDLTTLAGLDDNPAEIPGWGPVIADVARQVAREQDAEWRRSQTPRPGRSSTSGPPVADRPVVNNATWNPAIPLASSPVAGCRRQIQTSITDMPGRRAGRPRSRT
jgi:hypothetical protein